MASPLDPAAKDPVTAILGAGGALARALPGYEERPDQLDMAHAVADALERRRYLIAEAGTGTGKTLAYLTPAILSGRKVVVSTATKTLQEQIWFKDLPLLQRHCGLELSAAYLKGRANYLCLARFEKFAQHPTFPAREEAAHWPVIAAWARRTDTGDRSELDLPDQYGAWRELSATGETCLGRECDRFDDCFVTRARALAGQADVVLVNHHLFFADLAMRTSRAGVEVLPAYEAVVFDEAHALEETATEYFGLQLSSYRVEELCRDAGRAVGDRPDLAAMMRELTAGILHAGERFFGALAGRLRAAGGRGGPRSSASRGRAPRPDEDLRVPLSEAILAPLAGEQQKLDAALEELRGLLAEAESSGLAQLARRAGELRVELGAVTALNERSRVYFGELRGRGVFLRAAPIDVAEELVERLYRRVDTVVFTSATLAAQGRFDFFRRQVGLAPEFEVTEASYPGPFDYRTQAALVVPQDLPEPAHPGFGEASARAIEELTAVTGGRAFVLCTSNRAMRQLREACRHLPYRLLLQGELPKHRLVEQFRAAPSVLFATQSFWEGVDVPGEALSLVVIDKLPFAPPGDPVVQARLEALAQQGRDGFSELQVPAAALALRQGFGRLIRSTADRGIVVILDRRLLTKGYGRAFLASLPPAPLLRTIADARRWWERG